MSPKVQPTLVLPLPSFEGGLLATSRAYQNLRADLLKFAVRAPDLLRQIQSVPDSGFRLVFPTDVLDALKRGELHLLKSKDGLGFAPTLADSSGHFAGQVRIEPDRLGGLDLDSLANSAAHAQTHALLLEVLTTLKAIEQQVGEVLANQRAGWRAKIAAGLMQFRAIERDPGERATRAATLANSLQCLAEGRCTGQLQLEEHLRQHPKPQRGWFRQIVGSPRLQSPSDYEACLLDRVQDDFNWLYTATVTIARLHEACDRETLAREELPRFALEFGPILDECGRRYDWAKYSTERAHFWNQQLPLVRSLCGGSSPTVVVEFDQREIQTLLYDVEAHNDTSQ